MSTNTLKVHPNDNVIVALTNLAPGNEVHHNGDIITIRESVEIKHKFTVKDMVEGEPIIMYGVMVGKAKVPIPAGHMISQANVAHATSDYRVGERRLDWHKPDVSKWEDKNFLGYHRADGSVGTMNYWLVIPLVFCENRNVQVIKEALLEELGYRTERAFKVDTRQLIEQYKNGSGAEVIRQSSIILTPEEMQQNRIFPNIDGIKFLTHDGGCGGTRQDSEVLCNLLAGYIAHPNVAGATVLSLGCQNAQIELLQQSLVNRDPNFNKPVIYLEQQRSQSERELISTAVKETFIGLMEANSLNRQPAGLQHLKLGLECGGSDGFSGLSANPALGYASDLLVALGGTAILSEFPELNGVEQELVNRCVDEATANKFAKIMKAYAASAEQVGSSFAFNPSPGNIRDGLITDAIKSAGAAKKGGTSPVTQVLDYTEPSTQPGLNLLCTPGNDVESTTGLAGSGSNIIVFTTGLGTPTGNPIAPTIKVATNNALAQRMADIIDINAGTIISGADTIESKGAEILDYIIEVASGRALPKAVQLGQDDFIPWKRGVSL